MRSFLIKIGKAGIYPDRNATPATGKDWEHQYFVAPMATRRNPNPSGREFVDAEDPQSDDRAYIWVHESSGGVGLTGVGTINTVERTDGKLRLTLRKISLFKPPLAISPDHRLSRGDRTMPIGDYLGSIDRYRHDRTEEIADSDVDEIESALKELRSELEREASGDVEVGGKVVGESDPNSGISQPNEFARSLPAEEPLAETPTRPERRVWLRAFWGFGPEDAGYLGFTNEGNRDRFIREYQDGDLVLIYGADQAETRPDQRRQLLGFLEVEPVPIKDVERSSEVEKRRKSERGWRDRWTYAVPVRRAWSVNRRIAVRHVASETFRAHNPVLIASRSELLTPAETVRALALPVTPVNVYGQPPLQPDWTENGAEVELRSFFQPSAGVKPTFGERSFNVEDEENRLYVLKLDGDVAHFLGRGRHETFGKIIVKVGHAKEPKQRRDAHNSHLPPACAFRWNVALVSRPFLGGEDAKRAEDLLKQRFDQKFESLGGEFFLGEETTLFADFSDVTSSTSFNISAVS